MRICQLQNLPLSLILAIFLAGCSTPKVVDKHNERQIVASWLKIPLRFTHVDQNDNYLTHPFFDIKPDFNKERRLVNFFITVPEDGANKYNFDLYSGKLYKEREYCPMDDIWEFYSGTVERPNFTQGIVPQTYDENQKPQRIIVFSKAGEIEAFKLVPTNFDTARIVGSVVLEACENYPCDMKYKWTPSQILLAVNSHDSAYSGINQISELRNKVDWNYVKSILVNQDGAHQVGKRYFPAYRISRELNLDDTMKYFEKNSKALKMDELTAFREGCFKLYDDVWEKISKVREDKHVQQTKFLNFFKDFYKNKGEQFYLCQKLARPANINEDPQRLWFFAYLQAFANLERSGFYYSCTDRAWAYNPKVDDTHYFNDQNSELNRCRARDVEKAFDQAINGLSLMKNQINKSYRFIEYDTQHGGSHQKIYGWVEDHSKAIVCKNKKDSIKENQFDTFPQDVEWPRFMPDEDLTIQ